MKKIFYYTTTAIIISCGISQAQTCVPTPTCSSLGYTSSSSCTNGIKCPFGEAWNCDLNKITELTNKITELEKQLVANQSQGEVCIIGSILYSDKSCYLNPIKGKTPIGIVIYIDGTGGGQALALKSIGSYQWSTEYVDISGLTNCTSDEKASQNFASCENSAKIRAQGDSSKYPAVWAAHEYSTEGTNAGDWCLPAAGIFTSYYNNQEAINIGFSRTSGTPFTESTYAWSSSESSNYYSWASNFSRGYGLFGDDNNEKKGSLEVRPVIEF